MKTAKLCLSAMTLSAFLVLSGCNGGEDFSDAIIGGPIRDTRPGPAPIPDIGEEAVEIELVVGIEVGPGEYRTANIANIGYSCTESSSSVPDDGLKPFIARCAPTADRVEFFIGGALPGERRISLGTAYLPMCTGRSVGSTGQACGGGTGFFQVALADLIPINVMDSTGSDRPLTTPARREFSDPAVRNRAAFLFALDQTSGDRVITIDPTAHNNASAAPETDFNQSDYNLFIDHWDDWVEGLLGKDLPDSADIGVGLAKVAADRTRIGLFSLEHEASFYAQLFQDDSQLGFLSIVLPFIVMPDGSVGGVGAIFGPSGSDNAAGTLNLLALNSDSLLSDTLLLNDSNNNNDWNARSVLSTAQSSVDLFFQGRIIGAVASDNKLLKDGITDFRLEYPASGIYVPKPADWARFRGNALEQEFSDAPYRVARTGFVGAVLDEAMLNQLPDFYRLTLYKACTKAEADSDINCLPIPAKEIGPGLNYQEFYDNDQCDPRNPNPQNQPGGESGCSDTDPALDMKTLAGDYVGKERPRGGAGYAFAAGFFNVQFLDDGSIVTDRRGECRALDPVTLTRDDGLGGADNEAVVGFISRTLKDNPDDPDDVAGNTVTVVLFMTGSAENGDPLVTGAAMPPVPHYGTQIQGRIDLTAAERPMRRLGDENFKDGVRAFWQDFYQAGRLAEEVGRENAVDETGHRIRVLQGGAAQGEALDGVVGNCQPVGVAP